MGIVQVVIDRQTSMIIEGVYQFDRADGGTLVPPSGSAFPSVPVAGEFFWRTDTGKLYRRSDDDTAWVASTSDVGLHASTHTSLGSDPIPNAVSGGASGLFSGSDKSRLDSLATILTPLNPSENYKIPVASGGTVSWSLATDASIATAAGIQWNKLQGVGTTFLDPNGFTDRTQSTVSVVNGTRTFTIAPSSTSYDVWSCGTKYTKSTTISIIWPDVEGLHYFYFDQDGVIQTTQSDTVVEDLFKGHGVLIASIHWASSIATTLFLTDERHGFMPQDVRYPWYLSFGTQWLSGGLLGNFTLGSGSADSNAQLSVSDFKLLAEDMVFSVADGSPEDLSPTLQAPVFYRSGASGVWRRKTADTFPFIQSGTAGYTSASGRIAYNQWNGSTWALTELAQDSYVVVTILGTTDPNQPVVAILGQVQYNSLSDARIGAGSELEVLSQLPYFNTKRMSPLGVVILQSNSTFSNSVKARVVAVDSSNNPYLDVRGYTKGFSSASLPLTNTAPANVTKAAATVGTSLEAARADHKHDVTTASPTTLAAGGTNTEGTSTSLARADHVHALPAYGSTSGTIAQGDDSRFSDDRTASGIRTATTVVSVSTATAPTANQALLASSGTSAAWGLIGSSNISPTADIKWTQLEGTGTTFSSPSGFSASARADSTISKVDGTRTFTIAPVSTSFDFWSNGTHYQKSVACSVVWPDVEGTHVFYFDTSGVLQTTSGSIEDVIQGQGAIVSAIYWDATNNVSLFFAEERHGFMGQDVHLPWHLAFGAQWVSGGLLGNFSISSGAGNADAQFSVADFRMLDEDLIFTYGDGSPQELAPILYAPVFYRSGPSGVWRRKTADAYPLIQSGAAGYTGAAGRAAYNQWDGVDWQLTEVGQGDYFVVILYGSNDPQQPVIAILGQNVYATVSAARTGVFTEVANLSGLENLFAKELVSLGAVLYQTSTAYSNSVAARVVAVDTAGNPYVDLRGASGGSASGGGGPDLATTSPLDVTKATASVGTSLSAARADHKHDIATATASNTTVGGSSSEGTATSLARSDHTHAIPAFGSTAGTFCQGSDARLTNDRTASGLRTATTTVAVSTATAPSTGQVLTATSTTSAGWQTPTVYANVTSTAPLDVTKATAAVGVATTAARADHKHDVSTAVAGTAAIGDSAAEGTATSLARSDHKHSISSGTPVSVGTSNADGAATTFARSNHVHDHGSQTTATHHAVATTSANGFLSSTDKTKLDNLSAEFGRNYLKAESLGQSTTTSTTFQSKTTLATGALTGKYLLTWYCLLSKPSGGNPIYSRFYNTTDAAVIGGTWTKDQLQTTDKLQFSGSVEVTLSGTSKTYAIQYRGGGGNTAAIEEARIEMWKVSA